MALATTQRIGSLLKLPGRDILVSYLLYTNLLSTAKWNNSKQCLIFVHTFRKKNDNTYQGTTWQIKFTLENVNKSSNYKLRVALASATYSELQVHTLNFFFLCNLINGKTNNNTLFSSLSYNSYIYTLLISNILGTSQWSKGKSASIFKWFDRKG